MAGNLFIVSAPSGAGKTTLVHALLQRDPQVCLSISYTTREPRPGEENGKDYFFIDVPQFRAMRERDEFLEWAEVHGNYYGTSQVWLEEHLRSGHDVLLEIDWQGARQVRSVFPEAVSIFILPPSAEELRRRLVARGQDSPEVVARRLAVARDEIAHLREFDYVIFNNDLQAAAGDLEAIARASRLRCARQRQRHAEFFDTLEQS